MLMPPDLRPGDFARIRPHQFAWLALACVAGTAFAATRPADDAPLQGRLTIVGSRSMAGIVSRWATLFRRRHPGVRIVLMPTGSGTAAGAMADGQADLAPLPRRLHPRERSLAIAAYRTPRAVLVGVASSSRQPLYMYVNQPAGARTNAAAAEFIRIALSPEGQAQIGDDDPADQS